MKKAILILVILTFIITLIIGCVEDDEKGVKDKHNKSPNAEIGEMESHYFSEEDIHFTGLGYDTDSQIVLYEWDFDGDGIYDFSSNISAETYYTFPHSGQFNVTLLVTDDKGATGIDWILIDIYDTMPPAPPEVWIKHPKDYTKVTGIVEISGWVEVESRIELLAVQIRIDNSSWVNATLEPYNHDQWQMNWTYFLDTSHLPSGEHVIKTRTIDDEYGIFEEWGQSITISTYSSLKCEPEVKVTGFNYTSNPSSVPYQNVHSNFSGKYTGSDLSIELRNLTIESMLSQADDLGENTTILFESIKVIFSDWEAKPNSIPTYAEKAMYNNEWIWALAFNRANGFEDGIGHIDLFFVSISTIEAQYITGCNSTAIIFTFGCD